MSNNLNLPQVIDTQDQKEVTINEQSADIDAAITELLTSDYTSGNIALTDAQFREAVTFRSSNLSVARVLTCPAIKHTFIVDNAAGTNTLTVTVGSTTVVLAAGANGDFYTDGTTNGLILTGPTIGKLDLNLGSLREIVTNDIDTSANHGGILTSDSTPTYARVNGATDKALRVSWASSNSDEVQFPPMFMPPDLDETQDVIIHLLARMSGATDTPTIDVQVFDGIGDTEMGGATAALSSTLAELTVTISAADISGHPTGFLNISLVPGAHTTDILELYAAWAEYTLKSA